VSLRFELVIINLALFGAKLIEVLASFWISLPSNDQAAVGSGSATNVGSMVIVWPALTVIDFKFSLSILGATRINFEKFELKL
jgi:hypothetical protein